MTTLSIIGAVLSTAWVVVYMFTDHGTYRWPKGNRPAPALFFVFAPGQTGWVKLELGIAGRQFWITWGHLK